jgi:hypothetical protein
MKHTDIIGPGDDDYGRKKLFWKRLKEVREKLEHPDDYLKCQNCGCLNISYSEPLMRCNNCHELLRYNN